MSFDKMAYNADYNKNNYQSFSFRLAKAGEDADIIKHLKAQPNLKPYLCSLIRKDMKEKARKSRYVVRTGSSYEHDHVKQCPYEVIEDLPYGDHYSIGYAATMDDAALLIMNYVDQQGTINGQIFVVERSVAPLNLEHIKEGTVYARKVSNG